MRYAVAATSLKLPDALKRRLERLAARARKTPHAFMLEVLSREAERAELRERFAAEAAESEQEVLSGGKTYSLASAFSTSSSEKTRFEPGGRC